MNISKAKLDLAIYYKKGVPVLFGAIVYWIVMLIIGTFIRNETILAISYLYGTGLLFPLGILISKIMGINLLKKLNPLSSLSGILAAIPAFMGPLIVYMLYVKPIAVPFAICILTAGHFFPFAWLYETKLYIYPPIFMIIFSSVSLIYWSEKQFIIIPLLMAFILTYMVIGLQTEFSTLIKKENVISK